jgi:hypothetical protein
MSARGIGESGACINPVVDEGLGDTQATVPSKRGEEACCRLYSTHSSVGSDEIRRRRPRGLVAMLIDTSAWVEPLRRGDPSWRGPGDLPRSPIASGITFS